MGHRFAHMRRSPPIPLMPQPPQLTNHRTGTRGMGHRFAHMRRSPPIPLMPQPPKLTNHRTGTRGWGRRFAHMRRSPPIPLMPRRPQLTNHRTGTRGWGRRFAHMRRSPPHPPHAPTAQTHELSYGHEGDGGDVSLICGDLRPIPLMPLRMTPCAVEFVGRIVGVEFVLVPPGGVVPNVGAN